MVVVLVPVLLTISPFFYVAHRAVMHTAVGTSLALVVPNAFLAAQHQYKMGNFYFPLLKQWVPFVIVGAIMGVSIMKFIPNTYLKIFFYLFICCLSIFFFEKKKKVMQSWANLRGCGNAYSRNINR
ncbi:sulfite exporter TauE/SafE family protein [Coxiella-like endosymbiont]|uniref:sulfite exporter TauE/SafE family protein n=1 Tax=Coxiella-like endosymbiont TaxID=1592897 RepID=UPI002729F0A6|nr:sulfite exporter TauE/SafE family protein [Coxiella-like endosymbiont]